MRLIHYLVINKETNKKESVNCEQSKCQEYINNKENTDNYAIVYNWVSI